MAGASWDKQKARAFYLEHGFDSDPVSADKELHHYVANQFGRSVPTKSVCPHHVSPFSALADAFFERERGQIWLANRTGGKTMNMALVNSLNLTLRKNCDTCKLGAIRAQAAKGFGYVRRDIQTTVSDDEYTIYNSEQRHEIEMVSTNNHIQVVSATFSGLNSPHPQKVDIDEVEVLKNPAVLEEAFSMSQSYDDVMAQDRIASTRKRMDGIMQRLIDRARGVESDEVFGIGANKLTGFKVYEWCLWETIERCTEDRSCSRCPLYSLIDIDGSEVGCQGMAKNADGYYLIDDAIWALSKMDPVTFSAQWLCRRPEMKGAVYMQYDQRIHMAKEPIPYDPNLPLYVSMDFGYVHPFCCLWMQLVQGENGYIQLRILDEYYVSEHQMPDNLRAIGKRHQDRGWPYPMGCFAETHGGAAADGRHQIETLLSWPTQTTSLENQDGIAIVRYLLGRNKNGDPRLILSPQAHNTSREFLLYRYKPGNEEPVKEWDNAMDCIRQLASNLVEVPGINDGMISGVQRVRGIPRQSTVWVESAGRGRSTISATAGQRSKAIPTWASNRGVPAQLKRRGGVPAGMRH